MQQRYRLGRLDYLDPYRGRGLEGCSHGYRSRIPSRQDRRTHYAIGIAEKARVLESQM